MSFLQAEVPDLNTNNQSNFKLNSNKLNFSNLLEQAESKQSKSPSQPLKKDESLSDKEKALKQDQEIFLNLESVISVNNIQFVTLKETIVEKVKEAYKLTPQDKLNLQHIVFRTNHSEIGHISIQVIKSENYFSVKIKADQTLYLNLAHNAQELEKELKKRFSTPFKLRLEPLRVKKEDIKPINDNYNKEESQEK